MQGEGMPLREQHLQNVLDSLVAAGAAGVLMHYRDEHGRWSGASGVAEIGTGRPVDPDGWFRIGSVTKTFTAAVVLSLVGDGVLRLDDSCERWLPGLVPGGDGIVVRQLLNHTSGLYNYTDDLPEPKQLVLDRYKHWEPQRAIGMATAHDPLFAPGSSWSYSNTNYILLGLLIEAATGRSYAEAIRARVLEPLGLQQTIVPRDEVTLPEPHAHGYLPVDGERVDLVEFNASQAWAAGEIVSTAGDLDRFYAALLTGDLLRPTELQALLTTVPTDTADGAYGLGISRVALPGGSMLWGHTGTIFGYLTCSYHSADVTRQVTLSYTGTDAAPPGPDDLLASLFD
jgi:D-alanyl-D-alanine carboxypeptidase